MKSNLMRPDVVVSWPKNNDYPLWRKFIRENAHRFTSVIIVYTDASQGFDYRTFVSSSFEDIPNVLTLETPEVKSKEDWREVAIKEALRHSKAKWIWFTEQDFYPKSGFFEEVKEFMTLTTSEVIAVYQQERMHPCSIFINRNSLMKLSLNFAILPNVADHFYAIQRQIEDHGMVVTKSSPNLYHHYNGLSHNWNLIVEGKEPNYRPDEFKDYLIQCRDAEIEKHEQFDGVIEGFLEAE